MKFGFAIVSVFALAFTAEGAIRRPRTDRRAREPRQLTKARSTTDETERHLKKEGGGGGGGDGGCPKFVKEGSQVPLDMQCNSDSACAGYCAANPSANCCCVATNAFGGGFCSDQFVCNDYGQCRGDAVASSNNEDIKIYTTANGEVIETGDVKVTVANDGKETIEIASSQQQKVQSRRPDTANNKPMGKGKGSGDGDDGRDDDDDCPYYSFDVHCDHSDGGGSERYSTTDTITAKIYAYDSDRGSYSLVETQTFNGFCSSGEETIYVSDRECDIERIDLYIDGDSALLVDYIELWNDDDNKVVLQWGVPNGGAWCLSTDSQDNQSHWGDFLEGGQCYSSLRFDND